MTQVAPVPSRQQVPGVMAARGMRSAVELGMSKPHGHTMRYYAGCRCDECRLAVKLYAIQRAEAKERGEANNLIDAGPVVAHMRKLCAQGVGKRQISEIARIGTRTLDCLRRGEQTKIRAQTARRVLAIKPDAARADGARIPAGPTWALLDELIASGYSRASLARELVGPQARSLQFSRKLVEVHNAKAVRELHARLRLASPEETAKALAIVAELRAEGFRPDRILREVRDQAAGQGLPVPTLETVGKTGRLRHFELDLIVAAGKVLTGDEA
jgi:hypothetical protein